jgi:hypothetical protein
MDKSGYKIEIDDIHITYFRILFSAFITGGILPDTAEVFAASQRLSYTGRLRFLRLA